MTTVGDETNPSTNQGHDLYTVLAAVSIKYTDLPRKVKKRLKSKLKKDMPMWRMNEIKIKSVLIDKWHQRKQLPDFRRYFITSYGLGAHVDRHT
jgi:hypothetical protein